MKHDLSLIFDYLKASLKLMLLVSAKERDFKVWLKNSISRVDEQLMVISLQELVDQKEIENQEERSRGILMQDICDLNA
jgi:hypothetical protein